MVNKTNTQVARRASTPMIVSIPGLRSTFKGLVIGPDDPGYDEARTVFPGGIDRRPAVIIRVADADDVSRVVTLARECGKDMTVFGSQVLWNDLLAHSLADELPFMIGNVLLHHGTPMFLQSITYNDPKRSPQLMDSRTFKGSENLLVQYHVKYNRGAQGHES